MFKKLSDKEMVFLLANYNEEVLRTDQSINKNYGLIKNISSARENEKLILQASLRSGSGIDSKLGVRVDSSNQSDLSDILISTERLKEQEIQDIRDNIRKIEEKQKQMHRLRISYELLQSGREKKVFDYFLEAERQHINPTAYVMTTSGLQKSVIFEYRRRIVHIINAIYTSNFSTLQLVQIPPMSLKTAEAKFIKKGHKASGKEGTLPEKP